MYSLQYSRRQFVFLFYPISLKITSANRIEIGKYQPKTAVSDHIYIAWASGFTHSSKVHVVYTDTGVFQYKINLALFFVRPTTRTIVFLTFRL